MITVPALHDAVHC